MNQNKLVKFYQQKVKQLVDILREYDPEKIILFGSVAKKRVKENSDIDLCIIKKAKDRLKMKEEIWDLLWRANYDWRPEVEIHPYPLKLYRERLSKGDPFLNEIEKGEVVYVKK